MSRKHHEIPLQHLLFPGLFLVVGLFTLLFSSRDLAFFFVGVAIVSAILVHKEH